VTKLALKSGKQSCYLDSLVFNDSNLEGGEGFIVVYNSVWSQGRESFSGPALMFPCSLDISRPPQTSIPINRNGQHKAMSSSTEQAIPPFIQTNLSLQLRTIPELNGSPLERIQTSHCIKKGEARRITDEPTKEQEERRSGD
jgi:hypothetical protein